MLRVVHVGKLDLSRATGTGESVRGLINASGSLGIEHAVCSLGSPQPASNIDGFEVLHLRGRQLIAYLRRTADLVHLHGAFVPELRLIAQRAGLPYVVTPHGGYRTPVIQRRKTAAKIAYLRVWERPFLQRALSVSALTQVEARDLQAIAPGSRVTVVPNTFDPGLTAKLQTARRSQAGRELVFLGRGDVYLKGLDRVSALAGELPACSFVAHVVPVQREAAALREVLATAPPNFNIRPPVYGDPKVLALAGAAAYLQLSRFEAFGISLVEAAAGGIPLILSRGVDLATEAEQAGAAVVLDYESTQVSTGPTGIEDVTALLSDSETLQRMGNAARAWADSHFSAASVRRQVGTAYQLSESPTQARSDRDCK